MLCQFVHSLPYIPPDLATTKLDAKAIRQRTQDWPRSVLPADTTHFTIGFDCGKWVAWWVAIAFRPTRATTHPLLSCAGRGHR